jgi:MoxR-like ATPase
LLVEDPKIIAERILANVERVIIGKSETVRLALIALMGQGHLLVEDVPGVGKTVLARSLAISTGCTFRRIQFTPDLLPTDVTGVSIYNQKTGDFEFRPGPIMAQVVLADEINRATPKTQSAMLEAMQERSVTVSKTTYTLEAPFLVLATQNPLEMEGTYPLPEAQLDRFLYKLKVEFPDRDELHTILERTTSVDEPEAGAAINRERILQMRNVVRQVPVSRLVQDYAIRILQATHPNRPESPEITRKFVRYGSSPRGAQALLFGAKILALLDNRFAASCQDIRQVANAALRHRIILNFEGEAEGVTTDQVIAEVLKQMPEEAS